MIEGYDAVVIMGENNTPDRITFNSATPLQDGQLMRVLVDGVEEFWLVTESGPGEFVVSQTAGKLWSA